MHFRSTFNAHTPLTLASIFHNNSHVWWLERGVEILRVLFPAFVSVLVLATIITSIISIIVVVAFVGSSTVVLLLVHTVTSLVSVDSIPSIVFIHISVLIIPCVAIRRIILDTECRHRLVERFRTLNVGEIAVASFFTIASLEKSTRPSAQWLL